MDWNWTKIGNGCLFKLLLLIIILKFWETRIYLVRMNNFVWIWKIVDDWGYKCYYPEQKPCRVKINDTKSFAVAAEKASGFIQYLQSLQFTRV